MMLVSGRSQKYQDFALRAEKNLKYT